MRGAAILGRTLDASIVAQLGTGEPASSVCLDADVFYGDTKLSPDRIRVVTAAGANATELVVRVRTTLPVDEPIVTLYLRDGCQLKTTRKYVLLSEVVNDSATLSASTAPEIVGAAPSSSASGTPRANNAAADASTANASGSFARRSAANARREASAGATAPLGAAELRLSRGTNRATPATARASGSRLKLDPVDLGEAHDPVLRASPELLTAPSTDPQQRSNAAALWQALNAQPQDILRNADRLKALEADLTRMLADGRKNEAALAALRAELQAAREERYMNWLVYLLLAIITLGLIAAVVAWNARRQKSDDDMGPWWRKSAGGFEEADAMAASAAAAALVANSARPSQGFASDLPVEVNLGATAAASRKVASSGRVTPTLRPAVGVPDSRGNSGFLNSMSSVSGSSRVVNAEELFDVQQQADFFLSLGNADKAVEVLRHHIAENEDTSALAYLDLFDLYHTLGKREEYEALRSEFNPQFNAQVPPFDDYTADTQGLEFYTTALSRIESLWPTPRVLDVIEESIFRKSNSGEEAFSLAAYRELLLLHAIAKKVVTKPIAATEPAPVEFLHADFDNTRLEPLSVEMRSSPTSSVPTTTFDITELDLTRPPASPRLGLDIDLTDAYEGDPALELPTVDAMDMSLSDSAAGNLIEFDLEPIDPEPSKKKP